MSKTIDRKATGSQAPGRKVKLELKPAVRGPNPLSSSICLTQSLPYFRSSCGSYVHRVRSGNHYLWDGEYQHTALHFWCGMTGFAGSSRRHRGGGHFFEEPPKGEVVCSTCEGRAIGAGQDGSHKINGVMVKYMPR